VLDCIHHARGDVEHCTGAHAQGDRIRRLGHMELGHRLEYPSRNRHGVGHLRGGAGEFPNPNWPAFSGCLETAALSPFGGCYQLATLSTPQPVSAHPGFLQAIAGGGPN
jgi:hypothetical protein